MKYKSVIVTKRGGPEVLQIVENDRPLPLSGQVGIRVLATPVCQDDVAARVGNRPFLKKVPFVPGYAILGEVESIGEGVTDVAVGDRVAALTNYGGHTEYICWEADKLVQVPAALDPAKAVVLMLNYLVPYQILERVVEAKSDEKALIVGASGGVGTAFLQLGKLAGLKMYGLASPQKHDVLAEYGAAPIDYRAQDFVEVIRRAEPAGLDYVFNGMGEEYFERGLAVLKRGGVLVHYGGPESFSRFLLLVVKLLWYNLLPNGKTIKGYGTHRIDDDQRQKDWTSLFKLLAEGRIKPIIAEKFPLLEAAQANALLESGQVIGNLVLLAPELL